MRIHVRLFAILKDRAGVGRIELDMPLETSVAGAVQAVGEKFPQIQSLLNQAASALNCEYVPAITMLNDGDELALIPPVSGG